MYVYVAADEFSFLIFGLLRTDLE